MPTATTESNGLMSKNDKNMTFALFFLNGIKLIKIVGNEYPWQREIVVMHISTVNKSYSAIIGFYSANNAPVIHVTWVNDNKFDKLRFFKKENDIYIFSNIDASSPDKIMIQSTSFLAKSIPIDSEPDSSYTEITSI